MAVPWLRLIDAALGMSDVMRVVRAKRTEVEQPRQSVSTSALGAIETRLAGVVVAALKEAFDRDHLRLELERQQLEAERQRAERLLRLELIRQAGDREIARLRLVVGVALAVWVGGLLLTTRLLSTGGGRFAFGFGMAVLLTAIISALTEQSRLARGMAIADDRLSVETLTASGAAGVAAPWLVAVGFVAIGAGILIS